MSSDTVDVIELAQNAIWNGQDQHPYGPFFVAQIGGEEATVLNYEKLLELRHNSAEVKILATAVPGENHGEVFFF